MQTYTLSVFSPLSFSSPTCLFSSLPPSLYPSLPPSPFFPSLYALSLPPSFLSNGSRVYCNPELKAWSIMVGSEHIASIIRSRQQLMLTVFLTTIRLFLLFSRKQLWQLTLQSIYFCRKKNKCLRDVCQVALKGQQSPPSSHRMFRPYTRHSWQMCAYVMHIIDKGAGTRGIRIHFCPFPKKSALASQFLNYKICIICNKEISCFPFFRSFLTHLPLAFHPRKIEMTSSASSNFSVIDSWKKLGRNVFYFLYKAIALSVDSQPKDSLSDKKQENTNQLQPIEGFWDVVKKMRASEKTGVGSRAASSCLFTTLITTVLINYLHKEDLL